MLLCKLFIHSFNYSLYSALYSLFFPRDIITVQKKCNNSSIHTFANLLTKNNPKDVNIHYFWHTLLYYDLPGALKFCVLNARPLGDIKYRHVSNGECFTRDVLEVMARS